MVTTANSAVHDFFSGAIFTAGNKLFRRRDGFQLAQLAQLPSVVLNDIIDEAYYEIDLAVLPRLVGTARVGVFHPVRIRFPDKL